VLEGVDQPDEVASGRDRLQPVTAVQGEASMVGVQLLAQVADDLFGRAHRYRRRPQ
jgi:hypothetical protein